MTHRSLFLSVASAALIFGSFTILRAQESPPAGGPEAAGSRAKEIEKLINDLGAKSFAVREDATRGLERIGKEAAPALEKAKGSSDSEVRDRAEYILSKVLKEGKGRRREAAEGEAGGDEMRRMEKELRGMKDQVDRILRELEGDESAPRGPRRFRAAPGEEFEEIGPAFSPGYGRGLLPGAPGRSFEALRGQGLGIRGRIVDPTLAAQLKLEKGQGVVAEEVLENSPAGAAGLKVHDILIGLDGKALSGPNAVEALIRAVASAPRGKPVELQVIRGGETIRLEVILKEKGAERGERRA